MSAEAKLGYKQTGVGVIPHDWEIYNLGELSDFITSGSRGWACYYSKSGALFIRSQNIKDGRLDLSESQFVNPPCDSEGSRTRVSVNDILITITGNSVGNVAIVSNDLGESYISQHVGLIRLRTPLSGRYICWFLSPFSVGNNQISGSQSGQSKPGLNLKNLRDFLIALPPAAEQQSIANALDDTDALISSLDQLIAKKRDIQQATMQQLLTGQRRLPGFSEEWEVKRLGDVGELISGGTPKTSNPEYWGGHIKWCTPTDITRSKGKYLSETERSISEAGLACSGARLLPAGSLLICTRATIGELKIATAPICTNQGFKSLVCYDGINHEFMYYKLLTMKKDMVERAFGSTFLEISKANISAITFSVPPLTEQTAIATILSDMDTELAALEDRRDKNHQLKQGMMQELLTGRVRLA